MVRNKNRIKVQPALHLLFLLACFFPYVSLVPLSTDVQPFALIFALLIIATTPPKTLYLPINIWLLGVPAIGCIFYIFQLSDTFSGLRTIANYLSLFAISSAGYIVFHRQKIDMEKFLLYTIIIWITIGILQVTVDKYIGSFLLSELRTTDERGVTSLATEPSFFGIMCLFYIFFFLLQDKVKRSNIVLALLPILLLAQSSIIILFLALGIGSYSIISIINGKHFLTSFFIVLVATFIVYAVFQYFQDIRLFKILTLLAESPSALLKIDASVNERFAHIFLPFKSIVDFNLFPQGIDSKSWVEYFYINKALFPDLLWYAETESRIMSGYGKIIFEFGLIGVVFIFIINYGILQQRLPWPTLAAFFTMLNLMLLSAIPLSHPLIGLIISYMYFRINVNKAEKNSILISATKNGQISL